MVRQNWTSPTNNGIIKRVIEMIGDILFFRKTNSWISKVIAKVTKGDFTHVGLIVSYDELTGVATIIESNRFIETRMTTLIIDDKYSIFSTGYKPDWQTEMIIGYAFGALGTKYDYFHIIGLAVSLLFKKDRYAFFNLKNRVICSELIDLAYFEAGVARKNSANLGNITPQELIEVYDLKEIRKGV